MASFSNIQSSWANQYGSIDTWNIKIRPLVIILCHNILVHQQGALNSLLTTIANRNYRANRSSLILQKKIRKFAQNKQTNKQTDKQTNKQTDKQTNKQTDREFKNRGHLIPCGLWIVRERGPIFWQRYIIEHFIFHTQLCLVSIFHYFPRLQVSFPKV